MRLFFGMVLKLQCFNLASPYAAKLVNATEVSDWQEAKMYLYNIFGHTL